MTYHLMKQDCGRGGTQNNFVFARINGLGAVKRGHLLSQILCDRTTQVIKTVTPAAQGEVENSARSFAEH
jgi:hypothetical protein